MEMSKKVYLNWFDNLQRLSRDGGFVEQKGLDCLISSLYKHSVFVEIDCPQSFDSSLEFTLKTGEKVYLANPCQKAFAAYIA